MSLASLSLSALVGVVALSCLTNSNVGLGAIVLAWLIGVYVAPNYGVTIGAKGVLAGFPDELFLTLIGVTLLFAFVEQNGTLARITTAGVAHCRGRPAMLPGLFFVLAMTLSAIGAGNIAAVALLAPTALLTAQRLGISPLLMTIMLGHGSIAGALSPLSPLGVIAGQKLTDMGLGEHLVYTFFINALVNMLVAMLGYLLCRGWRTGGIEIEAEEPTLAEGAAQPWMPIHGLTLIVLGGLFIGVLFFDAHLGLSAFGAAVLLALIGRSDDRAALRALPWSVILMVCGMSVLVSLCERTGAVDLLSQLLAQWASPSTIVPWMAGITGLISVFSSTSGVVLPTFLPTVPEIIAQLGGGDLLAVATAVNVGSNLVDVSSVSTLGALCVAATSGERIRQRLFRQTLAWGLSMSVVGALVCWLVL